jgi:hypothetical protein
VLALYPLMALAAAAGVLALLRHKGGVAVVALTGLWLVADVAAAHPDYLPYFNVVARDEAAYFSADSDLDWGQDGARLAAALERRGIGRVAVALQSTFRLERVAAVEGVPLWPGERPSGWVAAGIGRILHDRIARPYSGLRWLMCRRPVALIGSTVLLYEIPPGATTAELVSCERDTPALPR